MFGNNLLLADLISWWPEHGCQLWATSTPKVR